MPRPQPSSWIASRSCESSSGSSSRIFSAARTGASRAVCTRECRVITVVVLSRAVRQTRGGMPYGWPLKPFDRAHPVRANFNDPRISGASRAFHFGIDISAPNGTPVYAVAPGTVHLEDARAVSVAAEGREFGYWHLVPAVRHLERVSQHQLLGHVEAPWLHVHFAERSSKMYRNPLRRDGLTPWTDTTRPRVTAITFMRN